MYITRALLFTALFATTVYASPLLVPSIHTTDTYTATTIGTLPYTLISVVSATNKVRAEQNLDALQISPELSDAAHMKAVDMASRGYFGHDSPKGTTPWHWFGLAGYTYIHAGENLASGFSSSAELMKAWLNSPTHRANILGAQYEEIGIAMIETVRNKKKVWLVVQMFVTKSL